MPLPIAIPPWLRPQNPVEDYMGGVRSGAQIGEAQASVAARQQAAQAQMAIAQQRLQQQQQLSEMELMANQKIADERARREQQKIMIDAAYDKERLQLEQDKIQETTRANDLKAQIAARKFQSEQQYRQAIADGMDPAQALIQFGMGAGMPMTGMAAALKEARPRAEVPEATLAEFGGAKFLRVPGPNGQVKYQQIKEAGDQMTKRDSAKLGLLKAELKEIEGNYLWKLGALGQLTDKNRKDQFEALVKRHKDVKQEMDEIVGGPRSAPAPAPASLPEGAKPPHPDGTYLRDKSGRLHVVKNGVPVPLGQEEEPDDTGDEEAE